MIDAEDLLISLNKLSWPSSKLPYDIAWWGWFLGQTNLFEDSEIEEGSSRIFNGGFLIYAQAELIIDNKIIHKLNIFIRFNKYDTCQSHLANARKDIKQVVQDFNKYYKQWISNNSQIIEQPITDMLDFVRF